jgi:hypothetical protein
VSERERLHPVRVDKVSERRVVVTSPRRGVARRRPHAGTREIDEQTRLGEVYMSALVRSQLRLSLFVCTLLALVIGGLPLLLLFVPPVREARLLGLPLPWVLLAGAVYPVFAGIGWWYVRQAERNERDFADLVERG